MDVLAHGIGGRSDLPVPLWLAMYAGAMAVLVSFFAVVAFWPRPRLSGDAPGRVFPAGVQRVLDDAVTRLVLRLLGVAAAVVFLAAAWFGSDNSAVNPVSTWFYVWFWVGLVPASILLGPVWRLVNPLRGLAAAVLAARGGRPVLAEDRAQRLVDRVGYWPAAVSLAAFVWLELVSIGPDRPRVVAVFVTGYGLLHMVAGVIFGQRWFARGDGFEAYSNVLARLSVWGRRGDGRLVLRNPLDGLAGLRPAPGLVALVLVVLGSTAFDGLSRTSWWRRLTNGTEPPFYLASGTAGLALAIAAVAAIYLGALTLTRPFLRGAGASLATSFIPSLVPIAVGYTIAHYFSLVIFQGQAGLILASDPFGHGWDLFGTAYRSIDYTVVSVTTIAWVQVGAIIAGHILGVVVAHDRAVGLLPRRSARTGQYPLLAAMVAYTTIGIGLLVGA